MYKREWCTCKVVVLVVKPIALWGFRRRLRRWILKSLLLRSTRTSLPDSFPCRHVNLYGTIRTTTVRKWNKYTHIKHRTERLAERVWCTWSQSSLLDIYFRFSRFQSSLLLIYFRYGPKRTHLFTLWRRVVKHTEITVLVCEQKPFSLWFLCGRKSYPVSV